MGTVRLLREHDRPALLELCQQHPVVNLFVASRVARYGVERRRLGCDILGHFDEQGRLISALHVGANLVPVEMGEQSRRAFIDYLGGHRSSSSVMGPQEAAMPLYEELSSRYRSWQQPREVRAEQPLLLLDGGPAVEPEPRVQQLSVRWFESYFDASVRMYTEEVGVSPLGPDNAYAEHVRRTMREGRAYGIIEDGRVVYKSDVGAQLGGCCQVQGVWLDPDLRGQGFAPHAMSGLAVALRPRYPLVSLYVNSFNLPALATYARVGFRQIGTFSTVLY